MDLFWFVSNLYPDRFQKGCQAAQINLRNLRWREQGPSLLPPLPRRSAHLTPSKQAGITREQTQEAGSPLLSSTQSAPLPQARAFPSCPACRLLSVCLLLVGWRDTWCSPAATHVHAGLYYPWAVVGTRYHGGKQPCHTHPRNKNNVTRREGVCSFNHKELPDSIKRRRWVPQ